MKIIKTLLVLGVCSAGLWSCNNPTKEKPAKDGLTIQELTSNVDAERQHLFFRLMDQTETDSSVVYLAKSVFESDTVALQVEVLKGIQPGVMPDDVPIQEGFTEGSIKFSSVGAESDNFVAALGKMFGVHTDGKMTNEVLLPTVFSSNKEEVDLSKNGTYSFKLFFPNAVGEPAEMFSVLDIYRKSFVLEEKSAEYRAQVLSAFEGK